MDYCSQAWTDAHIPSLGSAPRARWWVALEQDGAWGAKAFTQSQLDSTLGSRLEELAASRGGRLLLVRDPLSHADHGPGPRTVLLAGGPMEAPWVASTVVDEPGQLLALLEELDDPSRLATPPAPFTPSAPLLLVCGNGRRDICCAKFGGPLARALATEHPGRVWECTHLGGHRFAVTTLSLPSRQVLARVDEEIARRALAGRLLPLGEEHDRGRSDLAPAVGAADAWLRARLDLADPAVLSLVPEGELVVARHLDGRSWRLRVVEQHDEGALLPASCGKQGAPASWWQVELVDQTPGS